MGDKAMDNSDLRTLTLLSALEKGGAISQRELSRTLNISLGLVNACLKKLCKKGLLRKDSTTSKRVSYVMTQKGLAEKDRLSYLSLQWSLQLYIEARKRLENLFARLSDEGVSNIVFYGASEIAEVAYLALLNTDMCLTGIVDGDRQGESFLKTRIIGPNRLDTLEFDKMLITALLDTKQQLRIKRLSRDWPQKLVYILPEQQR